MNKLSMLYHARGEVHPISTIGAAVVHKKKKGVQNTHTQTNMRLSSFDRRHKRILQVGYLHLHTHTALTRPPFQPFRRPSRPLGVRF